MFGQKTRHIIHFNDKQQLMELVFDAVNKDVVNEIACELPILAFVQNKLVETFPSTKFWHTKRMVIDVLDKNEQKEIIIAEHNRAHKAAQENVKQIMQDYIFPKMTRLVNETVVTTGIHKSKFLVKVGVGEILHIDIFSTDKKYFLTCIDKFSKFAIVQPIVSRTIIDIEPPILQLMNFFPNTKTIYCDNDPF